MDLQNLLNTIRDNATETYQDRVPEATQNNIQSVQEVMTEPNNAVVVNEFMSTLLNMIIKQVLVNKLFSNPLKELKKGTKPLGDTIEEIYTNFLKADAYDPTGSGLMNRKLPDTKTVFHRMNRQDTYTVTVGPEQLRKAFSSYEALGSYIQTIINSLFNSSELDEFIITKQIIKQAYDNNAVVEMNVADPLLGETEGKAFIKAVKTVSGGMVFPSDQYNGYLTAQSVDNKPIITFSRKDEQVLIIDNATNVSVSIDVLASIFNMSVAEFNETAKIVIDSFPDPSIRAALVDKHFFQIYDDLIYFTSWRNPKGLYDNYYLHIWQTIAYSPLVNAVVFRVASDEDDDKSVEEFDVTYSLATGVKSTNKHTTAMEGSSYITTLKGIKNNHTVTVTMGSTTVEEVETPTDITSDVYDSDTNTITIAKVTDDITITVTAS